MIKKFLSSELSKGIVILFFSMLVYNFINFIFHFFMGRVLGPNDYGTLAVLMSMIYLFGIPVEAIQNMITKYTSKFNINNENGKIKFLMKRALGKGFYISIFLFGILIIFSIFLSFFLKVSFWLLLITDLAIFSSFSLPVIRGVLQGRKKFFKLGNSMIIETSFKLISSLSLVILGLKVFGAIIGVIFGLLASLIFSLYFNKDILQEREEKISFKYIYSESVPYLIVVVTILTFFSLDIILAKRFFSPELAGQYSVLSMLGKMIFLGTFAISKAMFPIASERFEKKENSSQLFKKSLILISILCLIGIAIYYLFPEEIVWLLYGEKYLEISHLLVYSAISLSFLSLSNIILLYSLSINRIKKGYLLIGFIIIEIVLLFALDSSIERYIMGFMISNIVMFIGSLFSLVEWKI
ncbi:MAG: oligosaccharide flippase family protein [Nanoarchaeota archaeon]